MCSTTNEIRYHDYLGRIYLKHRLTLQPQNNRNLDAADAMKKKEEQHLYKKLRGRKDIRWTFDEMLRSKSIYRWVSPSRLTFDEYR